MRLSCNVKPNSGYCRRVFEDFIMHTKRGAAIEKEFLLMHHLKYLVFSLTCAVKVRLRFSSFLIVGTKFPVSCTCLN